MKSFLQKLTATLVSFGPAGIFLITLIDSAGVPLPGGADLLLVLLSSRNPALAPLYAGLAVLGSLLGTMFLYYLARKGGEAFLDRRTATGRGARFRHWYQKYGMVTVFVPALSPVPMPMKIPVFCAGALGVPPSRIATVVGAARVIRYGGLAWLGTKVGENSMAVILAYKWHLLGGVLALAAALAGYLRFKGR